MIVPTSKATRRRAQPTVTYVAPCDPRQGMGGGARLNLMLSALELMALETNLLCYDGSSGLSISSLNLSAKTRMFKISLPQRLPKVLKLLAVPFLILSGLAFSRQRPVVFAHSPGIASGFIGLVIAHLKRGYLIVDHMDAKDRETPETVYRLVLRSAHTIFAISHRLETEALELGARNVCYLPIFLDLSRFPLDKPHRDATRASLGLRPDDFVIGYFGSFSRLEGLPILLEAFSSISRDVPTVKLLIVGSRNVEGTDNVERIGKDLGLEKHMILLPEQPYVTIPTLMQATDLLVAPKIRSRENEVANPIKVYEYLASGVPCITTSVGETASAIEAEAAGFLAEPGNPESLESKIRFVLSNRPDSAKVAARGRSFVESLHSIQRASRTIRETLACYLVLEASYGIGNTELHTASKGRR